MPTVPKFKDLFSLLFQSNPPSSSPSVAPVPGNDFFSILPPQGSSIAPTQDDDFFAPLLRSPSYQKKQQNLSSSSTSALQANVEATSVDTAAGLFRVGYEVDDAGKDLLINIGRTIGQCGTCENNPGSLRRGFRAEVRGRILELSTQNGPHKLTVLSAQLSNNLTTTCPT
jgi:hypothetical protein